MIPGIEVFSFERLFLWPQKLKRFVLVHKGCNKNKTPGIFLVTKNKGDKNPVQIKLKPWPSPRIIAFRFVTLIENMGKQNVPCKSWTPYTTMLIYT